MKISRIAGMALGSVAVLFGGLISNSASEFQPIQYNHALHVEDLGLDCLGCHPGAETAARATIPNIDLCGSCHMDTEAENSDLKKIAEMSERGERIPWRQVHQIPDHAYFSHRRHVAIAGLECVLCHGEVGTMQTPFTQPFARMDMGWCLECHEERAVSGDCYNCHR